MKFKINKPDPPREFGSWKKKFDEATEIPGETFDIEEAWSNVRARLHDEPVIERKKPVLFHRYSAAAAALLFILLFITLDKPVEEKLIGNQPATENKKPVVVKVIKDQIQPADSQSSKTGAVLPQSILASNQQKKNNITGSKINPPVKDDSLQVGHKDPEPMIIIPDPIPLEPITMASVKKEIPDIHMVELSKKQSYSPMARSNLGRQMLKQASEAAVKVPLEEASERILIP